MQTRPLGSTGITVPRLGLGCATFGREIDQDTCFAIMDAAFERGIRLFDTAEAYGGGQARLYRKTVLGVDDEREVSGEMHSSEKIVGRWLHSRGVRDQIILVTKVTTNFTPQHVAQAIHASLDRLQTGFVDIYLYHQFDPNTPLDEAAHAAAAVRRRGFARAIGCSNYNAAQLAAALDASRAAGVAPFEVIECNYNLAVRDIETGVLPLAQREALGVITYSPLGAGFLTGKYTPDRSQIPPGTRFDVIPGHVDIYFSERNFALAERLRALSTRAGIPATQLALAWVLHNPAIDTVLVGARSVAHLDNAVAALSLPPQWHSEMSLW
jgi:aryl-alcohol dehydrogenase-like predicted oxidoreductase